MQNWDSIIYEQSKLPYFIKLMSFLDDQYENHKVYPPRDKLFNAFKLTAFEETRVVILGQDPYHQPNQANGLAFSVSEGQTIPPSLCNIYKLMYGGEYPRNGDLTYLAKQGVFLLNTVLSVRDSEPNSHQNMGWEIFTDSIISALNQSENPIVFMLWGKNAINAKRLITNQSHLILTAPHPSPLSAFRGFFDCDCFRQANQFLEKPIAWTR